MPGLEAETGTTAAETIAAIDRFNEAFNRHDVDGVMAAMTDDCVFDSTPAPDGQRQHAEQHERQRDGDGCPDNAIDVERQSAEQVGGRILPEPRHRGDWFERRELAGTAVPLREEEPQIGRQPMMAAAARTSPRVPACAGMTVEQAGAELAMTA